MANDVTKRGSLHELGDLCFAYLQHNGSWGWSNAGLVIGDGASLLFDTLFDLRLTEAMLHATAVVADAKTVYTGDILFIGGTPIVWAGPLPNWVAACDLLLGLDVETVVPGHGPVTDKAGVVGVRDYLAFVESSAAQHHAAGTDAWEAARDIAREIGARDDFRGLSEFGRIAVNVDAAYRSFDATYVAPDVVEQLRRMAAIEGHQFS